MKVSLCGHDTDPDFTGQLDPMQLADAFGYFILSATGYANLKKGESSAALRLFDFAEEFAIKVDKSTNSTSSSKNLKRWREEARAAGAKSGPGLHEVVAHVLEK